VSVDRLCRKVGMSRQNYYRQRRQRQVRQVDADLIVTLVKRERRQQPRLGTRKLQRMLKEELAEAGVKAGRDRMFNVLRGRGMLLEPLRRAPRTTNGRHALPVFRNLVKDVEATAPHQIWVGDLTYVRTEEGYLYLASLLDRFSRKIVGYHAGDDLGSEGCLEALAMALGQLPADRYPIHHSDRGCQYCCHDYVQRLWRRDLPVSMTEENHCYENAHAERIQGILKQEYGLGLTFRTKDQARRAVEQGVWLYNYRRPHLNLGYQVPAVVHQQAA
jgi:putative transposase